MKKQVSIAVFLILAVGLILVGCGEKSAQTNNNQTNESKVIELKFNDWGAQAGNIGQLEEAAAKRITEQTNGRVKVTPYFSQSLLKAVDTYSGVVSGVADISLYQIDMTPGIHDLCRVVNLPFTSEGPSFGTMTKVYQELFKNNPELIQENEKMGVKVLAAIESMPGYQFHTVSKPIRVPQDMKGLKFYVPGDSAEAIAMIQAAGGASVSLGPGTSYEALQKGLIDGYPFHFPAIDGYKTIEVLNHHTIIGESGFMTGAHLYIVNLETWNSLSPEDQKVIEDAYQWVVEEIVKKNTQLEKEVIQKCKDLGHNVMELTPAEKQQWYDLAKPQVEKWIKETEAKGLPAQKVYDDYQRLIKEFSK